VKVALFDIDGTLTHAPDANHSRAVVAALTETFGVTAAVEDIHGPRYAGLTTPGIALQYLRERNLPAADEQMVAWRRAMLTAFDTAVVKCAHPLALAGAHEALRMLRDSDVALGILTGNFRSVARQKLASAGLLSFFDESLSGFADDAVERAEIAAAAAARARVRGWDVRLFVVGDTPRDVRCGRSVDAKTIAVPTGEFAADAFDEADAVAETLIDAARFILASP
jgi:phosphoglycolate phosphatase